MGLSYLFALLLAFIVATGLFLLACRGLIRLLKNWWNNLGPFFRSFYNFLRNLFHLFRQAVVARLPGVRSRRWTRFSSPRRKTARIRLLFPPSLVRRLFARLVLWGRAQGLLLPPTLSPAEFIHRLLPLVPDRKEDLAYLAEVYREERYGGVIPDRKVRTLYRQAWQRVVRERKKEKTVES
ncbi:MAG: DUF4129 domain-containing protein [Firmicutes bacterium]|nr:DUF4129 domain-containing protein [Bacillota bacterium]